MMITITNQSVGLNEVEFTEFEIFPNPAQIEFTIRSESRIEEASIFNLTGQMVLLVSGGTKTIDVSELPEGVLHCKY